MPCHGPDVGRYSRVRGEIFETSDGSPRSAAVPWQQADVSLLEGQLDWIPTTPIAEALAALWQSRN